MTQKIIPGQETPPVVPLPLLRTAIEYQGIQHYHPIEFFGGEEALLTRQELDRQKR